MDTIANQPFPLFTGEFIGTMLLIILGSGVVANVLLSKTKGQNSGLIVIAFGWAMAVFVGVYASTKLGGGGHLTWKDNSTNEENFLLERITNGVFKQFKMTGANITSVKITGLTPGTSYTFRVRAAAGDAYSAYSNNAVAITPQ